MFFDPGPGDGPLTPGDGPLMPGDDNQKKKKSVGLRPPFTWGGCRPSTPPLNVGCWPPRFLALLINESMNSWLPPALPFFLCVETFLVNLGSIQDSFGTILKQT